jgi:hypothetical protein
MIKYKYEVVDNVNGVSGVYVSRRPTHEVIEIIVKERQLDNKEKRYHTIYKIINNQKVEVWKTGRKKKGCKVIYNEEIYSSVKELMEVEGLNINTIYTHLCGWRYKTPKIQYAKENTWEYSNKNFTEA